MDVNDPTTDGVGGYEVEIHGGMAMIVGNVKVVMMGIQAVPEKKKAVMLMILVDCSKARWKLTQAREHSNRENFEEIVGGGYPGGMSYRIRCLFGGLRNEK